MAELTNRKITTYSDFWPYYVEFARRYANPRCREI